MQNLKPSIMSEFKVNEYITLKLEYNKTQIYLLGKRFIQCKFLLINIPAENHNLLGKEISIDNAEDNLSRSFELKIASNYNISPEVEFWAHCSNLQVWAENNYNTKLLHRNIAFPLLRKLTEAGDQMARRVFKEEIAKRMMEGIRECLA